MMKVQVCDICLDHGGLLTFGIVSVRDNVDKRTLYLCGDHADERPKSAAELLARAANQGDRATYAAIAEYQARKRAPRARGIA